MQYKLSLAEYSLAEDTQYYDDFLREGKRFPFLSIGKNSYIEDATILYVPDNDLVYNLQIGQYSSLAGGINFIIDLNHDYKRASQGKIAGIPYQRPTNTKRTGQIIIMNDCWIGQNVTIMGGVTIGNGAVVAAEAVVTKDVPEYAIVGGNPAKIIGYRFSPEEINALKLIRWWNWSEKKLLENAQLLTGDIGSFISNHIDSAKNNLSNIEPVAINPIEKSNSGKDLRYLYIPDFEQDYPTYPKVIEAFIKSYSDTNTELLLYVEADDLLDDKLNLLNSIFKKYEDANCYINLHIDNITNMLGLFGQVDSYITNRSISNVQNMDMANLFDIPIFSCTSLPIFTEENVTTFNRIKEMPAKTDTENDDIQKTLVTSIKSIQNTLASHQNNFENLANAISQISTNQYAMNQSVGNLKYELWAEKKDNGYPIVLPAELAIKRIIEEKLSICRFGDGEFAIMKGDNRQKFQHADKNLAIRLTEVLQAENDNILICIPNIYGSLAIYNDNFKYNTRAYLTEEVRKQHYDLLDMNREYYDAFLSRPYVSYLDNNTNAPRKRFELLRKIWEGRDLLFIEGEKTRMGIGNDLFSNAKSIKRILGPAEQAFDKYDELYESALSQSRELLVLIALGPTATVLAYDLAMAGFQALDIGHVDLEYEWMLAGTGARTSIPQKYNNEVKNGYIVEDIVDKEYEKQILVRCC